ncbi:uncharacterized protein LAESUDRAFT_329638 [Laetiporus sulphureus 93-53]|uniref:DUF7928 domain-containing protein n=1 Tax=Laetiporus sulphureus 93-53 TaxID=1314785 RepID=A0A165CX90_9APHY|nr:uncharacterized protein LAESUDRAFT_329638 [Laetiporus sulphureus 93-53]KZT03646.1 hypothetical protein LAESUDRAFT_329638 [Laetiporus sulphureus 93-53]
MSSSSQDSPLRDLYLRVEPASDLGITTVVSRCLETEHFDVYPDNSWNKAFQNAVSKIGPTVAIKARTSAVQAVLDDAGYGARQIVLNDDVVPIISSVTSLPDASTSSSLSAALIREEVALVVWAESSEAALAAYNDLEHRFRHKARLCHCGRQPGSSISRGGSFGLLLPAFDVDRFDLSGLGDGLAPLEDFDTLHNIEGGQSLAEEFLYNTSDGYSVELAEPSFATSDMSMSQVSSLADPSRA